MLRKGEILGIAGLDGSGRTEAAGKPSSAHGREEERHHLKLHGKEIRNKTPREAISQRLCPADRGAPGHRYLRHSGHSGKHRHLQPEKVSEGRICLSDKQNEGETPTGPSQAMHIKTPSQSTKIRSLSGGNQQKVILGPLAAHRAGNPPAGRAHPRHRRGREIRDLPADHRPCQARARRSSWFPPKCRSCWAYVTGFWSCPAVSWPARLTPETATQEEIMTLAAKYV